MSWGFPTFNPLFWLLSYTPLRRETKYMSPVQIGRHYGPEAQRAAELRAIEREKREAEGSGSPPRRRGALDESRHRPWNFRIEQ